MPSPARRLAAIVVLLLSATIVAFVGLRWAGIEIGIGSIGSPTPLPAPPTAEPSGPSPSQGPLAAFAQIEDEVESLRGLAPADVGPPEILTRAELADTLPDLLEPPLDNVTLRAMGLLSADQDVVALTNQLYIAQVLGYYDFDAKRMVLVSDAGLTAQARITYAHEYTHALQDAAFDSGAAFDAVAGQRDRELALLGLQEGDASVAMVLWAIGHLTAEELAGITETPLPDMSGIPPWMVRLLEYPYLSGSEFVGQLYGAGGWAAVDAAYADPPRSSEQVLHPEKYSDREQPDEFERLDLERALGGDWTRVTETTMGEAWISTWLEGIGVGADPAAAAAAGWGGDRLSVTAGPGDGWALAWRISWDAPSEATEFEAAYAGVESALPFPTMLVRNSVFVTTVFQASDDDILARAASLVEG